MSEPIFQERLGVAYIRLNPDTKYEVNWTVGMCKIMIGNLALIKAHLKMYDNPATLKDAAEHKSKVPECEVFNARGEGMKISLYKCRLVKNFQESIESFIKKYGRNT